MNGQLPLAEARRSFHAALLQSVLLTDGNGIPTNADKHSPVSVKIAQGIMSRLGAQSRGARLAGQMAGSKFEGICKHYIEQTFLQLNHLRPGQWHVSKGFEKGNAGSQGKSIAQFDQYEHLATLATLAKANPQLAAAIGSDYLIKPDVLIARFPEPDAVIDAGGLSVDDNTARLSPLREKNQGKPILHASISCKWTLRSDRAQNARSEALNLVRNRKGRLPHVAVITGEPTPGRIASIALGTGDIDCVYHFALPELLATVHEGNLTESADLLSTMIEGKRLRDISDLPLDLVV